MAFEWLTQDSRDFLSKGYLINGTTAEERVKQIADTAEDWLGQKFSDKFYDYMSKGWYSLSSPIWANFGLGRDYLYPAMVVTLMIVCWVFWTVQKRLVLCPNMVVEHLHFLVM